MLTYKYLSQRFTIFAVKSIRLCSISKGVTFFRVLCCNWVIKIQVVPGMRAEEVIEEVVKLCRSFQAKEAVLYGSRAKGTARERSDIDIAVTGVENFDLLAEKVGDLQTLYSVDLLNMDTCRNELLLEDIREYGRKIL